MNIAHIRLFVRIAALGNISLAGKELGLSAAVASTHINKFEHALGVRLLHRTTRQVSLTQEGEAFLPHAYHLLDSIETACAAVGAGDLSPQGKLRVAAPASFGRLHLVPHMRTFLTQYPKLSIDLHLSDNVLDMVEGGFDVAIRDAELQDSSLVARKLAPVNRILCASPSYLDQHGTPNTPQDLVNHYSVNLIGLEHWQFDSQAGTISAKPQNRFRTDNGEAARDAAVNGLGIHLISTWCCHEHMQRGDLVPVLSDYPLRSNTSIWAVYPSTRLLAPKVRAFIDFYASCFGDQPYWDTAVT